MGKRKTESDVAELLEDWISVDRNEDKAAWEAWTNWRRINLGCHATPNALTVPTPFPPATINAAREYAATVQLIRKSIGWNESRAKINVGALSAYMG